MQTFIISESTVPTSYSGRIVTTDGEFAVLEVVDHWAFDRAPSHIRVRIDDIIWQDHAAA